MELSGGFVGSWLCEGGGFLRRGFTATRTSSLTGVNCPVSQQRARRSGGAGWRRHLKARVAAAPGALGHRGLCDHRQLCAA